MYCFFNRVSGSYPSGYSVSADNTALIEHVLQELHPKVIQVGDLIRTSLTA